MNLFLQAFLFKSMRDMFMHFFVIIFSSCETNEDINERKQL